MTQEEILEYNKRCAEFLNLHRDEEVAIFNMKAYPYDWLKFHSDWNWIMEVVEAIEKLKGIKQFHIVENSAYMNGSLNVGSFSNPLGKKVAVVQAINQFLIWYNENN